MYQLLRFTFFLLLTFISNSIWGQSSRIVTHLNTKNPEKEISDSWYYSETDQPSNAAKIFNDSTWVYRSSLLKNTKDSIFKGLAWFRKYIHLDSSLTGLPLALMINQNGASEIYIDGKLIYNLGRIDGPNKSLYKDPQKLPIIFSIRDTGTHTIAIRYANYNAKAHYEEYRNSRSGFEISIANANIAVEGRNATVITLSLILLLMCFIFIILSLLHFLLYIFFRESKSNLYFSIFSFCLGLAFFIPYFTSLNPDPDLQLQFTALTPYIFVVSCLSLSRFINELFSSKKSWRYWTINCLSLGLIASAFFDFYNIVFSIATFVLIVFVLLEVIVLIIRAIIKKTKGARIVGFGILFFALLLLSLLFTTIVIDGDYFINDSTPQGQLLLVLIAFAILSIPLSLSVYLAWKFASINRDLSKQVIEIKVLSEKNLQQEQEKQLLIINQNKTLEEKVLERTEQLQSEKKKSDDLLLNILPGEIAEELKTFGKSEARLYNNVSVLFTDFVNFTGISEKLSPTVLVEQIDFYFKAFDDIIGKYGLEKIKTIGDAYLAVCGMPNEAEQHAIQTVRAAKEMNEFVRNKKSEGGLFDVRIGIHSGPVVAGIVGVKKFAYDIWGDTVNMANRMESSGESGRVNISGTTYELVKEHFDCEYRGKIEVKSKGTTDMYFVN
ncbi:MAG: adenylate/guanylate cyclase domain-containing protein [Bacteroidota bacterium]